MAVDKKPNRYEQLIEHIFRARHQEGSREVPFERSDIEIAAQALAMNLPKNIGDVIYSFAYRLVPSAALTADDLAHYHSRLAE